MSPTKVIFDTDPGIDDAMALLFLKSSPALELLGITTVLGNASIDTTTRNALFLRQHFDIVAPVARGAAVPLNGVIDPVPDMVHGANGLGDIPLPEINHSALHGLEASRFIVETVRANPGEVTIIAVGRMTNLALALRLDPEFAPLAKSVVIMGGAFGFNGHSGNVTPVAEANIHGDPLAADEVFAGNWKVTVIGLDVTQEALMSNAYLAQLRDGAGADGQLIWDMTRLYAKFYHDITGVDGVYGHDSLAVAYVIDPALFTTRSGPIRVVTEGLAIGQTIQQPDSRQFRPGPWSDLPSHNICIACDTPAILDLYMNTIVDAA
ncbi:nucleoside hydrolase [uncultured Devosia sp.]|uniref:nucleoside hydrolase n=1 Tax=uncultured Devosia sp. TaxID=211434 RepID=UPI0035CA4E9A